MTERGLTAAIEVSFDVFDTNEVEGYSLIESELIFRTLADTNFNMTSANRVLRRYNPELPFSPIDTSS